MARYKLDYMCSDEPDYAEHKTDSDAIAWATGELRNLHPQATFGAEYGPHNQRRLWCAFATPAQAANQVKEFQTELAILSCEQTT
jgi:hypothetical protein